MRQFDGEDSDSLGNTPAKDPFRFKLKVLKTEEASSSSPITGPRTCEFCGKEFVNGKALGGHIRIHNQAPRKNNARASRSVDRLKEGSNLRPDMNMDQVKDGEDVLPGFQRSGIWDKEQICRLCNRTFPSVKSLFGHMRFHPERAYRGAQPLSSDQQSKTVSVSSTSEESDEDTEVTRGSDGGRDVLGHRDLLRNLPNWSRTDKRGRQSTTQAAHSLMSLSCMASRAESDDFPPGFYRQKYTTKSPLKKLKLEGVADVETKRRKHVQATTITGRESGHKQARSVEEFDPNVAKEANTDRAEIGQSQNQRRVRFQCSTCGRIFPTFQALGGHRSKHNKEKGTTVSASHNHQTRLNSSNPVLEASASTEITAAATPASAPAPRVTFSQAEKDEAARALRECARLLEEGHALRAHKRCHSPTVELVSCEGSMHGDNTGQSSLGMKESSTGDQASQVGTRGMEIDLNKPPPAEEEDGPMSRLN